MQPRPRPCRIHRDARSDRGYKRDNPFGSLPGAQNPTALPVFLYPHPPRPAASSSSITPFPARSEVADPRLYRAGCTARGEIIRSTKNKRRGAAGRCRCTHARFERAESPVLPSLFRGLGASAGIPKSSPRYPAPGRQQQPAAQYVASASCEHWTCSAGAEECGQVAPGERVASVSWSLKQRAGRLERALHGATRPLVRSHRVQPLGMARMADPF